MFEQLSDIGARIGGFIQPLWCRARGGQRWVAFCDEEGLLKPAQQINTVGTRVLRVLGFDASEPIVGTIVIVGLDASTGDERSLEPAQQQAIRNAFDCTVAALVLGAGAQ
jgi:hypothetical protein